VGSGGAIITGANGAIGCALVREFAAAGYYLGICCRAKAPPAYELLEEVRAGGGQGLVLAGDLAAPGEAARLVGEFLAAAPSLEVLVNNAGGNKDELFYYSGDLDWRAAIDSNLITALAMSRAVLPEMIHRRRGSIVNISSISGLVGKKGQVAYAAAKAGLHGFTKSLAREVGRLGIRVNAIAAGAVDSPATLELKPEERRWLETAAALERLGRAEEIAAAARFLASDAASFITGQVIAVDGGVV